jgi:Predicted xylanase/chitin deacetylase
LKIAIIGAIALAVFIGPGGAAAMPAVDGKAPAVTAVALTLEGLDSADELAAMVRLCRDEGIKVTFFIRGEALAGLAVKEAAAAGHEFGNYGLHNAYWAGFTTEAIAAELAAGTRAVEAATGAAPRVVRPPYNYYGDNFRRAAARLAPPLTVVKGLDTNDWFVDSPAAVADQIHRSVGGGEIVNVNMKIKEAAAALPDIIRDLKARGCELVTVSELLRRIPAAAPPSSPEPPPGPCVVMWRGETGRPCVALTFDDGGPARRANEILDILEEEGVRCTFFLLGEWIRANPDVVRRMADAGHEVANHSYSHTHFSCLDPETMREEILNTQAVIEESTARPGARLFRPPYGEYNGALTGVLGELGYRTLVMWDVDSRDWEGPPPAVIVRRVLADAAPGSIVLFHLHGANTAAALREIIPRLRARGYELTTVGGLLKEGPR